MKTNKQPVKSVEEIVEEFRDLTSVALCREDHSCCWDQEEMDIWLRTTLHSYTAEREREVRKQERQFVINDIINEMRLRDVPDEDGTLPVYTANEMANYLARENGDIKALTPTEDNQK